MTRKGEAKLLAVTATSADLKDPKSVLDRKGKIFCTPVPWYLIFDLLSEQNFQAADLIGRVGRDDQKNRELLRFCYVSD